MRSIDSQLDSSYVRLGARKHSEMYKQDEGDGGCASAQLDAAFQQPRTKLVWVETPANPTWAITDVKAFFFSKR